MNQNLSTEHLNIKRLVLSAMFLTLGIVLPFFTGQIQQIGNMLLPMHIPVMLCGLICGWKYGLIVGLLTPLTRSILFTMPVLYPTAIAMALELAAYGFITGYLYRHIHRKPLTGIYLSLLTAMVGGRIVWGIAMVALLGIQGNSFTAGAFFAGAFLNAIPGIIAQLVLIPGIMLMLDKTSLLNIIHSQN